MNGITHGIKYYNERNSFKDIIFQEIYIDRNDPAFKFINYNVIAEVDGSVNKWPGKHKYVYSWYILENNILIGINENPSRGYSFPIIRINKKESNPFLKAI